MIAMREQGRTPPRLAAVTVIELDGRESTLFISPVAESLGPSRSHPDYLLARALIRSRVFKIMGLKVGFSLGSQPWRTKELGESQTDSPANSAPREVAIDLAGDVALQVADDACLVRLPLLDAP